MTVIACRDRVMAADSGVWSGDVCIGTSQKLIRLPDGSLCGAAGNRQIIHQFNTWMLAGGAIRSAEGALAGQTDLLKPGKADVNEFAALWLKTDGSIWYFDNECNCSPSAGSYAVEGCMDDFLRGAMAAGASATEAVELAIQHGAYVRGPVQIERL